MFKFTDAQKLKYIEAGYSPGVILQVEGMLEDEARFNGGSVDGIAEERVDEMFDYAKKEEMYLKLDDFIHYLVHRGCGALGIMQTVSDALTHAGHYTYTIMYQVIDKERLEEGKA